MATTYCVPTDVQGKHYNFLFHAALKEEAKAKVLEKHPNARIVSAFKMSPYEARRAWAGKFNF